MGELTGPPDGPGDEGDAAAGGTDGVPTPAERARHFAVWRPGRPDLALATLAEIPGTVVAPMESEGHPLYDSDAAQDKLGALLGAADKRGYDDPGQRVLVRRKIVDDWAEDLAQCRGVPGYGAPLGDIQDAWNRIEAWEAEPNPVIKAAQAPAVLMEANAWRHRYPNNPAAHQLAGIVEWEDRYQLARAKRGFSEKVESPADAPILATSYAEVRGNQVAEFKAYRGAQRLVDKARSVPADLPDRAAADSFVGERDAIFAARDHLPAYDRAHRKAMQRLTAGLGLPPDPDSLAAERGVYWWAQADALRVLKAD